MFMRKEKWEKLSDALNLLRLFVFLLSYFLSYGIIYSTSKWMSKVLFWRDKKCVFLSYIQSENSLLVKWWSGLKSLMFSQQDKYWCLKSICKMLSHIFCCCYFHSSTDKQDPFLYVILLFFKKNIHGEILKNQFKFIFIMIK